MGCLTVLTIFLCQKSIKQNDIWPQAGKYNSATYCVQLKNAEKDCTTSQSTFDDVISDFVTS